MIPIVLLLPYAIKSFLACAIILGNTLVLLAFFKTRKLRDSETNVYLATLAFCDLTVGTIVIPALIVTKFLAEFYDAHFYTVCQLIYIPLSIMTLATTFLIITISVDRYQKINRDFFYLRSTSPERAYFRCRLILLISFFTAFLSFLSKEYYAGCDCAKFTVAMSMFSQVATFLIVLLPFYFTIWFNLKVYKIAMRRKRELEYRSSQRIFSTRKDEVILHSVETLCFGQRRITELIGECITQHKISLITMFINIGYVLTCPVSFMLWLVIFYTEGTDVSDRLKHIMIWPALSNSVLNPIILFLMHVEFRNSIKALFRSK